MLPAQHAPGLLPPLDPVGEQLRGLSAELGCSVVLESAYGTVVGHAVSGPVCSAVVDAVIGRDARPLREGLSDRRNLGLLPGGAVKAGTVLGQPVSLLPLPGQRGPLGTLWLLGAEPALDDPRLTDHLDALVRLMRALSQIEHTDDLRAVLAGEGPLPRAFLGLRLSVLALHDGPEVLCDLASRHPIPGAILRTSGDLALLGTPQRLSPADVQVHLERWCASSDLRVGIAQASPDELPAAVAHARLARSAGRPGCVTLAEVRSQLLLARVGELLAASDDLGAHPVGDLVRDHEDFAISLLGWLDAHADTAVASARLACHPNTLRYRVRRSIELLGGDLDDPDLRLETHLRLRAALA